jgi:hypothetical protein
MKPFLTRLSVAAGLLLGFLGFLHPIWADMGPSFGPRGNVFIALSFHGETPKGDSKAALLAPDRRARRSDLTPPTHSTERSTDRSGIPGLEARLAQEPDGISWDYCDEPVSLDRGQALTIFWRRLRSTATGEFPRTIRLAVYFPSTDQLFLTDPVATSRRDDNRFQAVFEPDGTGTMTLLSPGTWIQENYVLEMLAALVVTLIIELAVVFVWIAATKKRASARRVVWVALAGNLITLPAVWAASLWGKAYLDLRAAALIYLLAELGAILFEAALYAWLGRFGVVNALWLSFTANCLSFLCGCCLVSYF